MFSDSTRVRGRGEKSPLGHVVWRTEEPVGGECPLGLRPSLCKPPWGASSFGTPEMAAPAPSAWEAPSGTKNLETVCRKALAVLEISGAVCWGLSGQLHGVTRADPAGVPRALHAKRLGPMIQVAISEWPRCCVLGRPPQTGDLKPPGFIPSQLWRPV